MPLHFAAANWNRFECIASDKEYFVNVNYASEVRVCFIVLPITLF